ncbi:unnamed protein product [Calypogeia fissa]
MQRKNDVSRSRPDADHYQSIDESPLIKEGSNHEGETTTRPPALNLQETETGTTTTTSDDPLTTKKELWGWYLYEASSSGFSGSVLPIFLPLLLVTVATDQAWKALGRDSPLPCDSTHTVNCLKCDPGNGDRLLTASGLVDLPTLRVYFGSLGLNPVSFTTVVLGISVMFQLVTFISAGPLVDYGDRRKSVMTVNTIIGSVACILCFAIYKPELWWLGGVLCVIANVGYGLAYIAYNTYLPLLTDATPEMHEAKTLSETHQQIIRFRVENRISLMGIAVGAILGAVCVVISFVFALIPNISTELILRIACLIGGIWWLVGYIPSLLWLKRRPRPPLPVKATPWLGWIQVWELMKESRKHKYAWRFLVFFFIFSDGYTTVSQIGILFAQQELCMSTPELAAIAVVVNIFVFLGMPIFGYIQRKLKWNNNRMLILSLLMLSVLPVYGIIGYFTPRGSFGLKHASESFVFSSWYGVCLGALLSYSRTLFIDLIPIGSEGAMFSLWSLSSRGSAWVGPFVVAIIVQYTGDLRSTFIYTLVVILVPIVLLYFFIDNEEGLRQSGRIFAEQEFGATVEEKAELGREADRNGVEKVDCKGHSTVQTRERENVEEHFLTT